MKVSLGNSTINPCISLVLKSGTEGWKASPRSAVQPHRAASGPAGLSVLTPGLSVLTAVGFRPPHWCAEETWPSSHCTLWPRHWLLKNESGSSMYCYFSRRNTCVIKVSGSLIRS